MSSSTMEGARLRDALDAIQNLGPVGDVVTFRVDSSPIVDGVPEVLKHGDEMVVCFPNLSRFRAVNVAETKHWNVLRGLGEYFIRRQHALVSPDVDLIAVRTMDPPLQVHHGAGGKRDHGMAAGVDCRPALRDNACVPDVQGLVRIEGPDR